MMRIQAVQSRAGEAALAIDEISTGLDIATRGRPDFLALHFGAGLDAVALQRAARSLFGQGALHGGSSCLGVMGQGGVDITGDGLGAFAIWDAQGSFGTGAADLGADADAAARHAAHLALEHAGRPDELPDLVWLSVTPGREEQALAGLRAVFGAETLIVGGSIADNDVTGQWSQFGPDSLHRDGIVVSVLFPTAPVASVYQSGYAPTGDSGIVTGVQGRRLTHIDGRPAAEVYHGWTNGAVPLASDAPLSVLADATLWPLGRVTRHVAGVPFHLLAHPAVTYSDGSLDLFADVHVGDQLWQMQGSADSLVARAGQVAAQARSTAGGAVAGALVVYCGGCMLAVRSRMDEVCQGIEAALGDIPWLGVFTFGEQGVPYGGTPEHANLMISCTVIAK